MQKTTKESLRIYFNHAKKRKFSGLIIVFSTVSIVVVNLFIPIFYSKFFGLLTSTSITDKEILCEKLFIILFQIFSINFLAWILTRFQNLANNFFESRVSSDLLNTCFESISKHSLNFFNSNHLGSLVQQVNRFIWAFEGIHEECFWYFVPLALEIFGIFFMVSQRNFLIGIIFFLWTTSFVILNCFFAQYKYKYDLKFNSTNSDVTGYLADAMSNNFNIKIFSGQQKEKVAFERLTEKQFRLKWFSWNIGQLFQALQAIFMVMLEFTIFFIALKLWKEGKFASSDFVLIEIYLINLFRKLLDFERIIRQIYEYLASAEEMSKILSKPHYEASIAKTTPLALRDGMIEFRDVQFSYSKDFKVFSNLSFKINAGEKVAIVGPSGSGKSTLFKLLLRLYNISFGQILIDGQNIENVDLESLRKNISIVPQEPILFQRSILENIRYGNFAASDDDVKEAARLADCYDFIMKLPDGFDTLVGDRGFNLSGGGRQHIAIARAILKKSQILLLDEATSSMDSYSELLTQNALKNLIKDKTVIVIAHRLSTIMKMDRIIVMNNGSIVEEGTHEQLMLQQNCLYNKLWNTQEQNF